MLAAKAEETAIISLWHYFCLSSPSYSVYLTGSHNIYPTLELLLRAPDISKANYGDKPLHCRISALSLKNAYWFENW